MVFAEERHQIAEGIKNFVVRISQKSLFGRHANDKGSSVLGNADQLIDYVFYLFGWQVLQNIVHHDSCKGVVTEWQWRIFSDVDRI